MLAKNLPLETAAIYGYKIVVKHSDRRLYGHGYLYSVIGEYGEAVKFYPFPMDQITIPDYADLDLLKVF